MIWEAIRGRKKGKSPKLQRKWRGPGIVLRRYTDVTYLISFETKQRVVHFDVLKPYKGTRRPRWVKRIQEELERQKTAAESGTPKERPVREAGSSGDESSDESSNSE
jgi:hypothetical protein